MSSFNEATGLGYLKNEAIEFVKYPFGKVDIFYIKYLFSVNFHMHVNS